MLKTDILILGAGIAGLGAALKARDLGRDYLVCEAGTRAGGLLDNFEIQGFRFDQAVHLSFAKESFVRDIFDKTPYITHPSTSRCFESDRWLKHPVQNNLYPLDTNDKVELIQSFFERPDVPKHADYDSWLRYQYGDKIAERYPMRYTRKYWRLPASELSTTWIGERMRRSNSSEVLSGALSAHTPNHYYTKEFRYPKKGGYKGFIQTLIKASDIRFSKQAIEICPDDKIVTFSDGTQAEFKSLISTMPLPKLINRIKGAPDKLCNLANMLKVTSVDLVSFGFKTDKIKDLMLYIYDEDIFASRAYSPSVKSKDNVPRGCSSIQFEVYGLNEQWDKEQLIQNSTLGLKKLGLAIEEDILFSDHRRLPFGNVVFFKGMEEIRDDLLAYTKDIGIASCGRFGAWEYYWSNQSLISGYEAL